MSEAQLAFVDVRAGMNACDPPHKIGTSQVARMVNCVLVDGLPTTRAGCRVIPIEGTNSEFIAINPVQGSIHYNPAKGQGGIALADSNSSLALGCGGKKFLIGIKGRRCRAEGMATDITNGCLGNPQHHLVWLAQWENLLILADGEGPTFIYDPATGGAFSRGYNSVEKLESEIPNGATCLIYAHARGVAVVNSNIILVGDSLHRTDLAGSSNLKEFTEQVYWATGQYFMPPSSMGRINAAAVLPVQNTVHGHGDIIFHEDDGLFSLDINQAPRANWANLQLVRQVLKQAGACGPYAVAIVDGDQFYRSRIGIQSIRSAAAGAGTEGNPIKTLSPEVDTWLLSDYPRWLRFASVNTWDIERRLLVTAAPIVQGSFRYSRGAISRKFRPVPTSETPAVWEGLWTLPPEVRGIVQFVNGIFDGEQRQFAWCYGNDARNRLVEFSTSFREDELEAGPRRIRCQVQTRAIDSGKWWQRREFGSARLYLRNISGKVAWGVWFRPGESPAWIFLRAGILELPDFDPANMTLVHPQKRSISLFLGKIPSDCTEAGNKSNQSRSIQFLVRWEGYCTLEGVKVTHGAEDIETDELDQRRFSVIFKESEGADYDDFEYSETPERIW